MARNFVYNKNKITGGLQCHQRKQLSEIMNLKIVL